MHLHGTSSLINSLDIIKLKSKFDINKLSIVKNCHPEAECHNTIGSFKCICLNGLIGDGITACDDPTS